MACLTPHLRANRRIAVLYDGQCGLCKRTVRMLRKLDWMHKLSFVDFHHHDAHKAAAPDLTFDELNKALHIRLPDGRTYQGYSAFRMLARHLPPLWITVPFLHLPGARLIGDKLYANVAARRKRCTHEGCEL